MKLQVQCMKALLGERMLYFSTENPGGRSPNLPWTNNDPNFTAAHISYMTSYDHTFFWKYDLIYEVQILPFGRHDMI